MTVHIYINELQEKFETSFFFFLLTKNMIAKSCPHGPLSDLANFTLIFSFLSSLGLIKNLDFSTFLNISLPKLWQMFYPLCRKTIVSSTKFSSLYHENSLIAMSASHTKMSGQSLNGNS